MMSRGHRDRHCHGAIPQEDVPSFVEAIKKEWDERCKWSSCKAVYNSKVSKELILPSRVCYRWKPTPNTGGYKAKARIVIQGFRDPHLPLLTRGAPVLSRNGMMVILQWSASHWTTLWNADAKSAFLQGLPDPRETTKRCDFTSRNTRVERGRALRADRSSVWCSQRAKEVVWQIPSCGGIFEVAGSQPRPMPLFVGGRCGWK